MHVRINLQTGLKEAKLLAETEKKSSALVYNPEHNTDLPSNGIVNAAELKDALKKIKDDSGNSDVKETFKSYEKIKEELEGVQLTIKSDAEVLKDLIQKHSDVIKSKNFIEEELLIILEDLEYLVHQYDNAVEFINLNGFQIVYTHLNSSNVAIKLEAIKLLGSSIQNNPKVQIYALETGAIDLLLRILALDDNFDVKNRIMFGLGCLLRRFPLAQLKFLENAGLSVFAKLFDSSNIKVQIKVVTLLNDLLIEYSDAIKDRNSTNFNEKLNQYKKINLKKGLLENNFCIYFVKLLKNVINVDKNDYDSIEKSLHIIDKMINECDSECTEATTDVLMPLKAELNLLSTTDVENQTYYLELYNILSNILKTIKFKQKSEL